MPGDLQHEVREHVAQRVREARAAAELTQEELADRAGVSSRSVQFVEAAETTPTVEMLVKIARGLGTTASALLGDL